MRDHSFNSSPMNKEDAWIVGLKPPDSRRVGIDKDDVAAYRHLRKLLRAVPHGRVSGTPIDDLELVAMHVPRVTTSIEVIDYDFNTIFLG